MTERYDTFQLDGQDYMKDMERSELPPFRILSESTLQLLAALPVVMGLLSLLASLSMITAILRARLSTSWTTYHGLLGAMTICNVVFSITMMLSSFMYDKETSFHIWAVGNVHTCKMIGFLNQFSNASIFSYMMSLSIYFLLSTRFRLSNEYITRKYETAMHALCLGFALGTSYSGLFIDAYRERSETIGCWIRNCDFDENGLPVNCLPETLMNIAGRWWAASVFFVVATVAVLIALHYRKRIQKQEHRNRHKEKFGETTEDENSNGHAEDDDDVETNARASVRERERKEREMLLKDKQRLRQLRIQSLFFVCTFLLCTVPTTILRFSKGDPFFAEDFLYVDYMEIPYNFSQLMLAQAILAPLLPFGLSTIYMWPKYMYNREHFERESRWWVMRRTIFGSSIHPTHCGNSNTDNISSS